MEERGARIHTDCEGKKRQTESAQFAGHTKVNAVGFGPGRQDDCKEEDGRRAQSDSLDLHVAEGHADADQEEQEKDRLISELRK